MSAALRRRAVASLAMAMADLEVLGDAPGCHLIRGKLVEAQALAAWCWPDCRPGEPAEPTAPRPERLEDLFPKIRENGKLTTEGRANSFIVRALWRANVRSIEDLGLLYRDQMMEFDGLGSGRIDRIAEQLGRHGFEANCLTGH